VTKIDFSGKIIQVFFKKTSEDSDSLNVLYCNHLVITIPIGVLQKRQVEFVPPLPNLYLESIDGLRMALMNKIVLIFKKSILAK